MKSLVSLSALILLMAKQMAMVLHKNHGGLTGNHQKLKQERNYVIGHDNSSQLNNLFVNPLKFDLNLPTNKLILQHITNKGKEIPGLFSSEIDKDQHARNLPPDIGVFEAK